MTRIWRKRQHGYLYMDALIAMFILAVAVVAIMGAFIYSTKLNSNAAHYTAATNIARQQMELLKKWSASDWSDPDLPASIPWQGEPNNLTVNKTTFEVRTIVDQFSDVDPNLVQITVSVAWNESSGSKYVQLTTYFSKV